MKILKVYKQLTDVILFQDDDGSVKIRARYTDDGTPEEQSYISETVGSPGFKASVTENLRADISAVPPVAA